jgi:signal transduction histidine kinase
LALQAATELMERPDLPPQKQKVIVHMLKQEGERMKRMVQGYLELARFDSGRMKLKQEVMDLEALVEEVAEIQRPQAAQKQIDIVIAKGENLPIFAGDEDKLRQLLLNLISNAIKYNHLGGQIVVHLTAAGDELTLAVEDTGPGIAPQNLARLFERFYRVPGSEGYTEGTGLGLSIAQKIVEAHHGRIKVTSELGKGTTFHCIFTLNKE